MPYVTYVEFNVPDSKQAAEFYKKAFGWEAQGWGDDDYMVVSHGDEAGIDAGLDKAKDGKPLAVPVITVPSVDEYAGKVKAAGGEIVIEKFPIPSQGYAAYFTDPGGLTVGIYENDENAK